MYKLKSFLVIAALMAATVAQAQVKKPAETEVKQMSHTQVLFENMLQATQKLLIIDHLFKAGDLQRVIIFCGKKDRVKDIDR